MANGERIALGEVAEINPPIPRAAITEPEMKVSFVGMSGVSEVTASVLTHEVRTAAECRKGYTAFQRGDVLVAKITPCFENGKIVIADISHAVGFGSTEFHVIRPSPDKLDPRFLLHFLRVPFFRVQGERRMTGSAGQRRVPANFLSTFDIPLPPLPLQRRIAEVLDKAEALRAKRRAALAQLDSLTQSLFLDLFGDPVANPRFWPLRSFDEMMRDETSRSKKLNQSEFSEAGKFPVIDQGQSSIAGYCDDESMLCVSVLPVVVFGDHTRAVKFISHPFVVGADGAKVLVPESGIDAVFLAALLQMLPIPNLGYSRHMREVKRLNYIAPPLDLQREFARRVAVVEKLKTAQRAALAELDALFASLQHRAFRGEL